MPEEAGPPPLDKTKSNTSSISPDENAFLWFDGILEGPVGDRERLRACTNSLGALGIVKSSLEIEGGKFSLLLDDQSRKIAGISDGDRRSLMDFLQEIVDSSPDPSRVESTLRCTEIHSGTANETLFAVNQGQFEKVSRSRSTNSDDLRRKPRPTSVIGQEFESPKSKRILVVAAVVIAAILVLWQSGIVDQMLAPEASAIAINQGPFGDVLDLDLTKKLGVYELTVSRGNDYPATMGEIKNRINNAADLRSAAMLGAIARGEVVFVQMADADGELLFEKGIGLKALLLEPDAKIRVPIPGRRKASGLFLALTPDSKH